MFEIITKRIFIIFSISIAICLFLSSQVNANIYREITLFDTNTGFEIAKLNNANQINMTWTEEISVKVMPGKSTDKMRLEAADKNSINACQFKKINTQQNSSTTNNKYFVFTFKPKQSAANCSFKITGWKNPWGWLGQNTFNLKFSDKIAIDDSNQPRSKLKSVEKVYQVTQGTNQKSQMILGAVEKRSAHGVRIYCPVSHFAYDDPVIFPNKPGLSHLHMFIGNTNSQANSTATSLLRSGNSSCEGGINVRSSYWTPALFNGKNEVVMPEQEFVYYKTFIGSNSNYDKIQIIPNGLAMLADRSTLNSGDKNFVSELVTKNGKEYLLFEIFFPNCIATTNNQWNGTPILSYKDMPGEKANMINSHVAYSGGSNKTLVGCPASHPYLSPTMSLKLFYDTANLTEGWYLASDVDQSKPGSTLHADYIAAWDSETMNKITECNQESRSCGFDGGRGQLSDRFNAPDGQQIYVLSNALNSDVDRTPFGDHLKPTLN